MATTSGGIVGAYATFSALTLAGAAWIGLSEQPEKQKRAAAAKATVEADGTAGWWRVLLLSSLLLGFYVGAETGCECEAWSLGKGRADTAEERAHLERLSRNSRSTLAQLA